MSKIWPIWPNCRHKIVPNPLKTPLIWHQDCSSISCMSTPLTLIHELTYPTYPIPGEADIDFRVENMDKIIHQIRSSESKLRLKYVQKLRQELGQLISEISMSEERKSYFLHQMSYARELDEIENLVKLLNHQQITQPQFPHGDLVYITETPHGLRWIKHSL